MTRVLAHRASGRIDPAPAIVAGGAWLAVLATVLLTRAPVPIDETRYLDVAWEMWRDHAWLVPRLNGEPYADKPPLMFWSILAAWHAFGAHESVARCVPPLYALGSLALVADLGRALWPPGPGRAGCGGPGALASIVLAGTVLWTVFAGVVMFDAILGFFTLAALRAVVAARDGGGASAWLLAGLALGGGLLAKGPAAFVHVLPVALLAPCWSASVVPGGWRRWYAGVLFAGLVAAALGLGWALPAAGAGGAAYRTDLLMDQTAGRVTGSFAHARPWWWYLPLLPLLAGPWLAWPGLWRGPGIAPSSGHGGAGASAGSVGGPDAGVRLCLTWALGSLAIFSLVSGKQPHYLVPALPAVALLTARRLSVLPTVRRVDRLPAALLALAIGLSLLALGIAGGDIDAFGSARTAAARVSPLWGAALMLGAVGFAALPRAVVATPLRLASGATGLTALATVCLSLALAPVLRANYDADPLARRLGALQRNGAPLAHVGDHHGQFGLAGRLERPIEMLACAQAPAWARAHPQGWLVVPMGEVPGRPSGRAMGRADVPVPGDAQPWRTRYRTIVPSSAFLLPEVRPASDGERACRPPRYRFAQR